MCEAHVGVSVKNMTVLYREVFSSAGDRPGQKYLCVQNHRIV